MEEIMFLIDDVWQIISDYIPDKDYWEWFRSSSPSTHPIRKCLQMDKRMEELLQFPNWLCRDVSLTHIPKITIPHRDRDYIDYLHPKMMDGKDICRFEDMHKRPGIIMLRKGDEKGFVVLFQRYQQSMYGTWCVCIYDDKYQNRSARQFFPATETIDDLIYKQSIE
jgi:hypothetical protein